MRKPSEQVTRKQRARNLLAITAFAAAFWAFTQLLQESACFAILLGCSLLRNGQPLSANTTLLIRLFSTALTTLSAIAVCRLSPFSPPDAWGLFQRGAVREYLLGIPIGVGLFGGAVALCGAVGALSLTVSENVSVPIWLLFLLGYLLQGMSEEVLCRGLLMGLLQQACHPFVAISVNSAVFALLHCGNNGVTPLAICNVFLFGLFASILVLRRGSLPLVCAVHSLWNFSQGNLFGISVSGTGSGPSLFRAVCTRALWCGETFGMEGGLAVTLVLLAAVAAVAPWNELRKKQ